MSLEIIEWAIKIVAVLYICGILLKRLGFL